MKLYDFERSGNCHKVRLLLSLLGLDYERVAVDTTKGESTSPAFRQINPRGQIPVLEDDGTLVWDSMAILVFLARRYGGEKWLPNDALGEARVMQWLAVSENELLFGLARARTVLLFGRSFDLEQCQREGRAGLEVMEGQLTGNDWLAADRPTIADVACFPYVALAHEAGISLEPYPAVHAWVDRMKRLPGYVGMPGIGTE
jgi:glutathione S-transferase